MNFRDVIQNLMQQQSQQAPISDMDMQRIQQQQQPQPQQQAPISDMDIQKMQQMMQQLNPDQLRALQQEMAGQSAPAASPQQMMQQGAGSGLGSLPNAFMQRLQQQKQNQVPQDALGLGYGVQR
jgi:hypothetical protein